MAHLTKARDGEKCSLVRGGDNGAVSGVRPDRELVHLEERAAVRGGCDHRYLGIQCGQDPAVSQDNTLKVSILSQLCSWSIALTVTLIDIFMLIVMMDGHSNGSKHKETHCKVNWDADLYDRWSNLKTLTARVIRLRPTPEETILHDFIPDHINKLEIIEVIIH